MSGSSTIKVYARVRPSKAASEWLALNHEHGQMEWDIPVDLAPGIVNNSKTAYKFKFDGLFDMNARQDDVFTTIAKDACDNALEGYNATVFAYGQTGSGKTFTITGGDERYQDRGIIPRTISYMFNEFSKRSTEFKYNVYISYLEIYNDTGYDLLDPSHETKSLKELPKVTMMEDDVGNVHLKNLSLHHAANEEDALNFLFLGDTNRAISETAMNLTSSRSHCIFTLSVEARAVGSDVVRRSKLHLVDLAGSERVHKTAARGQTLREATYINKSLHYLELVIKQLSERSASYIPYRNSMMTNVLRDSLGGNCKTVMIATLNPEKEQTGESISTCRFAQRVACVKNSAIVNEETDPYMVIERLRSEVAALKAEVAFLKGEGPDPSEGIVEPSTPESSVSAGFGSSGGGGGGGGSGSGGGGGADPEELAKAKDEAARLRQQLKQRDSEIAILVNMVKAQKGGGGGGGAAVDMGGAGPALPPSSSMPTGSVGGVGPSLPAPSGAGPTPSLATASSGTSSSASLRAVMSTGPSLPSQLVPATDVTTNAPSAGSRRHTRQPIVLAPEVLASRDKALEVFLKQYNKASAVEENQVLLKSMYDRAKSLAEEVNRARKRIKGVTAELETYCVKRAMAGVVEGKEGGADDPDDPPPRPEPDDHELELTKAMDDHKAQYHSSFQKLREAKKEIERIQRSLEAGKVRMHSEFEAWYSRALVDAQRSAGPAPAPAVATGALLAPASVAVSGPGGGGGGGGGGALAPTVTTVPRAAGRGAGTGPGGVPLTGNPDVDQDILAFYQAREAMLHQQRDGVK